MKLVTVNRTYKYEVAFSFLQQDEGFTSQLNDLVRDRLSTFIYSEHQDDLVGKDGINSFTNVFSKEARIVVVLYREGWGTTSWTKVEETAIKNRAFEEGYDFTIFISLDNAIPVWLPKTQIWCGVDRYGIKSAAAIIEERVTKYGGQVREETVKDRAERYKREGDRKDFIKKYLTSTQGQEDCKSETLKLLSGAEKNIQDISDNGNLYGDSMTFGKNYASDRNNIGLIFQWEQPNRPSIKDSYLEVSLVRYGHSEFITVKGAVTIIKKQDYLFYLNEADIKGWVEKNNKAEFKTTEQLIDFWQKDFLDVIKQEEDKKDKPQKMTPMFGKNASSKNSY